jgi:diaminohydroxyphosphoribosylaminopyrimidine deaminase/5-amino-6-(5-phosphoribosylamino)uracil reductase
MTRPVAVAQQSEFMDRALEIAHGGWGRVSPNPLVGAVIVRGGAIVGEGFHAEYGGEHAEVMAIQQAGAAAAGSTLYVTLEPCNHHGKKPPCTSSILEAGIERVVYGTADPDRVAAGGARELESAGLKVVGGVRSEEAARLNGPFIWDRLGRGPWVSLKLGLSLDGRIAARPGERTDITGPEAASFVHRLRAGHDAIMVGGRTAVIDDPLLTVRYYSSPRVPPVRVVLDPRLELDPAGRLVNSTEQAPLLVLCREDCEDARRRALEVRGAMVAKVRADGTRLNLDSVLRELQARGIRSVLAEGGGTLAAALLGACHARRQYLIYAPVILGPQGVPAFAEGTRTDPDDWRVVHHDRLGRDVLLELEDLQAREALREAA